MYRLKILHTVFYYDFLFLIEKHSCSSVIYGVSAWQLSLSKYGMVNGRLHTRHILVGNCQKHIFSLILEWEESCSRILIDLVGSLA